MAKFMFCTGTRYMQNDNEYIVRKEMDMDVEVENLNYKTFEIWSKEDLLTKWADGEIVFRLSPEGEKLITIENFNDLDSEAKRIAMYRYNVLKPVIEKEIQTTKELLAYLETLSPKVCKTVFYDWKSRWEKTEDLRALVPQKTGPKGLTTRKEIIDIIDEVLGQYEYTGEKFASEQLFSEVNLRIKELNKFREEDKLKQISMSTVHRRRKQILDKHKKDKEHSGPVIAKLNKEGVKQEVIVTRPLERVELDWTLADVMLIDPSDLKAKRPWFVYAIDRCTGYPLGFIPTFKPVDSHILKQLLMHIILPKTYIKKLYPLVDNEWLAYGVPKCIVVDNSSINDSYEFEEACYQVGVEDIQFCTVGAGHQKSAIERGFRTLNTTFFHTLNGTTFSNIFEKGVYNSQKKACITMETFIYMSHIVLVDLIANRNSSRRGNNPSALWKKGIAENKHRSILQVPRSVRELKILLMGGSERRTLQQQGVVIENEYYYSQELIDLKNELEKNNKSKEVRVRFDITDIRRVYVFDPNNNRYIVAEQTGFVRKKIDINYPVPLTRLELVSKMNLENKKQEDPTLRAKVRRKLEKLQNESAKEVTKMKKGKSQEGKETTDYVGLALGSDELIIPNNENIIIHEEEEKKVKSGKHNKSAKLNKDNQEINSTDLKKEEFIVYPDVGELPTFSVNYKKV